ncbi:hypothetical protein [Aliikangiella maris]|uniref:DUF3078 domain-containing protein n=2 Tax=Aliikangiella maris TaxID=3162458 RepID=A0ABV3MRR6_9GAMM
MINRLFVLWIISIVFPLTGWTYESSVQTDFINSGNGFEDRKLAEQKQIKRAENHAETVLINNQATVVKPQSKQQDEQQQKQREEQDSREVIYQSAVEFANFIDQFFGQSEALDRASYDYLRLVSQSHWQKTNTMDFSAKLKAKVHLPKINKRLSLIFSEQDESIVDGSQDSLDSWLNTQGKEEKSSAALNYEAVANKRSSYDMRIGITSGVEPFVRARHVYRLLQTPSLLLKNETSVFWQDSLGYGSRFKLEMDKIMDTNNLMRWKYSILRAEKSEGNEWRSQFSIINHAAAESWTSYDFSVKGKTQAEYEIDEYRVAIRYRRQLPVKWLYLEIEPEVRWKPLPGEIRKQMTPGVIFRFEIRFED